MGIIFWYFQSLVTHYWSSGYFFLQDREVYLRDGMCSQDDEILLKWGYKHSLMCSFLQVVYKRVRNTRLIERGEVISKIYEMALLNFVVPTVIYRKVRPVRARTTLWGIWRKSDLKLRKDLGSKGKDIPKEIDRVGSSRKETSLRASKDKC